MAGAAAMPQAADAARGMAVGAQDDRIFLDGDAETRRLSFLRMRELGMNWLRVNVLWAKVNGRQARLTEAPARPAYDWRRYDRVVREARAFRIYVQLTLMGPAPAWATTNRKVGTYGPKPDHYARFAAATASHFRGRVTRYSIWNEPNHHYFLTPQAIPGGGLVSPEIYRRLFEAGYDSIKRIDPGAEVLLGETCPCPSGPGLIDPTGFLLAMSCRDQDLKPTRECEPLHADGYAHHPYQTAGPPERDVRPVQLGIGSLSHLIWLLDGLARTGAVVGPGGRPLDLYLTEFGYHAGGALARPLAKRADYLPRAFEVAYRNPRVRKMVQYQLLPSGSSDWDTGILDPRSGRGMIYHSLRRWTRRRQLEQYAARRRRMVHPTGGALFAP
jgi:hypothetical protein